LGEGPVERLASVVGPVRAVVELAGDEDVGSVESGGADRLADLLLVAVHLRRVDAPVADLQWVLRSFDWHVSESSAAKMDLS
jgi:hypothetical protein